MAEYFPQVALEGLLEPARSTIIKTMLGGRPLSDEYLKFLVTELKPSIDSYIQPLPVRKEPSSWAQVWRTDFPVCTL